MTAGLMPGIVADRRALRKELIARRLALPDDAWDDHCRRIRALLQAGFPQFSGMRVGFCWPFRKEPDLRPLIADWAGEGRPGFAALLPVVIDEHRALAFRAWSPDTAMVVDQHGIPAPEAGDFLIPQALLIPVNGFDAAGHRIGYGGGYFDRTLASLSPRPLAVGVGFELARRDSIHPEPHDQRLDVMVTEDGIFFPSPGAAMARPAAGPVAA
ncbi:MAG: 5-formyltetrahydrofolate cyclo-ligase [Accumulibacter sp.]|jgi:5-formyltetrahydrofolate cyclo-ligase|uniref:5-formyltetrahydrofolate cyclo-ligase n=1 Tax=Accumulibacter sp. TaxID=2053492 RepID=UPI002FC3B02C